MDRTGDEDELIEHWSLVGEERTELAGKRGPTRLAFALQVHRSQIRRFTGFRECGVVDADKATLWLAEQVCCAERRPERVRAALLAYLRDERIEPPTTTRLSRMIASALEQSEQTLTRWIYARVPAEAVARMLALIARRPKRGLRQQ